MICTYFYSATHTPLFQTVIFHPHTHTHLLPPRQSSPPPKSETMAFFSDKIEVQDLPGKGKGFVAVTDIAPGTLLVKEEAFELAQGSSDEEKMLVLNHLLQSVHTRCMRDPTAKQAVEALYPDEEDSRKNFPKRDVNARDEGSRGDEEEYPEMLVDDLNRYYNILCCNTFLMEDVNTLGETSFALFLRTSRFNHSCTPHCHYFFDRRSILIRAHKPINKGEEVTISYCAEYLSKAKRQGHLKSAYHFLCTCPRCKSQSTIDFALDALACPTEGCEGFVTTDFAGVSRCVTCRVDQTREWVKARRAEVSRLASAYPLRGDMLALVHPKSDDAYLYYCRVMNACLKRVAARVTGEDEADARRQGLAAAKKRLACLQQHACSEEESLLAVVKTAFLCADAAEKAAFTEKAREMCLAIRGSDEVEELFPKWARREK